MAEFLFFIDCIAWKFYFFYSIIFKHLEFGIDQGWLLAILRIHMHTRAVFNI